MAAAAAATEDAPTEPPVGESFQEKIEQYRQFLISSETTRPFWYRSLDSLITAVATMCFVTKVVDPPVAEAFRLDKLEDFLNVSFLVKFLLLLWTENWNFSWLLTVKGAFDLASCLPVLTVVARANGNIPLERTTDILQIFRFLRLLREALPSDAALNRRPVPVNQQIVAVLLSLLGTIVISATVVYQYETPTDQVEMERTFEDALLYMVSIFAGRDPPWYPQTSEAKIASFMATGLGIIFIPFLISRSVELFMTKEGRGMIQSNTAGGMTTGTDAEPISGGSITGQDLISWVSLLRKLDVLENAGFTDPESAAYLRSCCLSRDSRLLMLDVCYGQGLSVESEVSPDAASIYAARLKELVDGDAAASVTQGFASTMTQQQCQQEDLVSQSAIIDSMTGCMADEARNEDTSDSILNASEGGGVHEKEEEEEKEQEDGEEEEDAEILAESNISGRKRDRFMSQLKGGIRKFRSASSEDF